jgi:hypothetical protein
MACMLRTRYRIVSWCDATLCIYLGRPPQSDVGLLWYLGRSCKPLRQTYQRSTLPTCLRSRFFRGGISTMVSPCCEASGRDQKSRHYFVFGCRVGGILVGGCGGFLIQWSSLSTSAVDRSNSIPVPNALIAATMILVLPKIQSSYINFFWSAFNFPW